jgi:MFS family permease
MRARSGLGELPAAFAALPRPVWFLLAGTLINRFGGFVAVFLVLYLSAQGHSPAAAGGAASLYGAGALASALLGGELADRLGRRQTIVLSMVGGAAAVLGLSQARDLPLILALSGTAGLFAELYRPASSALLADLIAPERRVTAFAVYRLAINLGMAAGPAVAGLMAKRSFLFVFVGDALTSVAFALIALVALPKTAVTAGVGSAERKLVPALRADPGFLVFLLASAIIGVVYFQSQSTLPLHVAGGGHSSATYGALMSLNGLLVLFIELPLSTITQRLPHAPAIAFGYALIGAGFALVGAATSTLALAATVTVWTVGEMVSQPLAAAHVANVAPPSLRGCYQGAFAFTSGLGLVLAPTLGTAILTLSSTLLWLGCGACGLIAALLTLRSARPRAPDRANSSLPRMATPPPRGAPALLRRRIHQAASRAGAAAAAATGAGFRL